MIKISESMQNIASCICTESINGDSTTIISAASASHIETKPGMIISPIANIANKIPQYNISPPLLTLTLYVNDS
jgi:hypothetical protein